MNLSRLDGRKGYNGSDSTGFFLPLAYSNHSHKGIANSVAY